MEKVFNEVDRILRNRELSLIVTLIFGTIIMSILSPFFFSLANFKSILLGLTVEGIMVTGMVIVLISGGIDLSVGSTMCFTGVVAGLCMAASMPIIAAIAIGLLAAVLVGTINGMLISRLSLNPFITTLGMSIAIRGLLLIISDGKAILNLPETFNVIGRGKFLGIQYPSYFMVFIVIVLHMLVSKNRFFRQSYYVGGNEKAAAFNGIDVKNVKLINYIIASGIAGMVGILLAARFGSASVTIGANTALNVITAAIIGGASLNGGRGSVLGAFLGAIFMQVLASSLNMLGVNIYYQSFITGIILIVAIIMDVVNEMKAMKIIR